MEENKNLGAGIIIITILVILGSILGIVGDLGSIFLGDLVVETYDGEVIQSSISNSQFIIDIILRIIFLISAILIFMKKSLGIYCYFIVVIISIIALIIFNGFSIAIISSLILPILMTIFVAKKREVFGL